MFDPNENQTRFERYLSRHLECQVEFIAANLLTKSSREPPWRFDVIVNGTLKSYVLQLDPKNIEYEYLILKAMEVISIPTPRVYGLDLNGEGLGIPCFFSDFIEGQSLLVPMLTGETWAEELFIDAVCRLQTVTEEQLGIVARSMKRETADGVLEESYAYLKGMSTPLVDVVYRELKKRMPDLPPVKFSNGDLWLDNFIVKERKLAGIVDFPNATFSDPIFEFLLPFFVSPELQGHGIEERYCLRIGCDPSILYWYHGLEYFDSLRWVMVTGEDYVHHTKASLEKDLQKWLDEGQ
jgi:aminoglycoside phosphotransferase (APT) family kinase protein